MPTKKEMLIKMYDSVFDLVTPDLMGFIETKHQIKTWREAILKELNEKFESTIEDEYEVLTKSYVRGIRKAAQLHSEFEWVKFQDTRESIKDFDLRFMRYITIEIDMVDGENKAYKLFGLPPVTQPPPDVYWGTAQDWINALNNPGACMAIRMFKVLPCNDGCVYTEPGLVVTKFDMTKKSPWGAPMIKIEKVKKEQMRFF